jgi:O-antigen/teichoic acid export membrane protein
MPGVKTEGSGISRLLKNTQIYFIGNVLNRLGAFLLLPLYTHYLTPSEYGTLELVLVSVALVKVLMGMNMSHATLRFYFEYPTKEERDQLTSTMLLFVNLWCFILMILCIVFSGPFSVWIGGNTTYAPLFVLGFILLFFEVTSEVPFACLRANEQSILFVATAGMSLFLRVFCNVYLVVSLQKGVEGVLIGNIVAAVILWGFLSILILKNVRLKYDREKMRALLKYSFPLVLATLPGLVIRNADRILLVRYTSLEVLGLYALAMRFRMILEGFVLEPFHLGFGPFRFSIMNQENAARTFATLLTWFTLLLSFVGLLIVLIAPETITLISTPSFYEAHKIVPLLMLATLLHGMHYVFQSGILITKKTKVIPLISTATAIANLAALYFLTPRFGAQGAALALVLTYCLDIALTYRSSQQVYPIPFELIRMGKIIFVTLLVFGASLLTSQLPFWRGLLIKLALVFFVFPIVLFLMKFPTKEEIQKLAEWKERLCLFFSVSSV